MLQSLLVSDQRQRQMEIEFHCQRKTQEAVLFLPVAELQAGWTLTQGDSAMSADILFFFTEWELLLATGG